MSTETPIEIESLTIDGRIFIAADDLCRVLSSRAAEYDRLSNLEPVDADEADAAIAYAAMAQDLRAVVTELDYAAIVRHTEDGDATTGGEA